MCFSFIAFGFFFFCPSEVRTWIIFLVSFTCHWARHKGAAFTDALWSIWFHLMTYDGHANDPYITHYKAPQDKVIQYVSVFTARACQLLLETVRTHPAHLYAYRGAHRPIKALYTPTGPQMGHSYLVSVGPFSPQVEFLQTKPEPGFFFSRSLKYQKCIKRVQTCCFCHGKFSLGR